MTNRVPLEKGRAYQAELTFDSERLGGRIVTGTYTGISTAIDLPIFKQIETGREFVLPEEIVVWFKSLEAVS